MRARRSTARPSAMTRPSNSQLSLRSSVRRARLPEQGMPSTSLYAAMTAAAPARIPARAAGRWISCSSRNPRSDSAELRPPTVAPCPAKCLSTTGALSPAKTPVPCMPRTSASVSRAARYGSSPKHSSVRPQRGSRAMSSAETRATWPPRARSSAAAWAAARSWSSGFQVAPTARLTGRTVPSRAMRPCGTSSTNSAGMPSRLRSTTCRCTSSVRAAPSSAPGPLPWPTPDQASARWSP